VQARRRLVLATSFVAALAEKAIVPFLRPAHRTGRDHLGHPALGRVSCQGMRSGARERARGDSTHAQFPEDDRHGELPITNLYRTGGRPIGKEVGEKVRALIDEHVIALGIDPTIPPISIMDAEFVQHVNKLGSPRAKTSEMEHALRFHIRKHYDEDPEHSSGCPRS
jgi:hypothetical protein